jgi:hypothetical protein
MESHFLIEDSCSSLVMLIKILYVRRFTGSGTTLDENYCRFLRNTVWVNTISLSLSSIFSSRVNADINQTKPEHEIDIDTVCAMIKKYDFTLRLSLNMSDVYNEWSAKEIFERAKQLGANQITFRILYTSGKDTPEDKWIIKNNVHKDVMDEIYGYIINNGRILGTLPFGATQYSVDGVSVVIDNNCMNGSPGSVQKYMILRQDCRLYSQWSDKASLIF